MLKEKDETMNRFAQHFNQLLNVPGTVDKVALDELPDLNPNVELDNVPSFDELTTAVASLERITLQAAAGFLPKSGSMVERGS